jgi:alpha-galactosidase
MEKPMETMRNVLVSLFFLGSALAFAADSADGADSRLLDQIRKATPRVILAGNQNSAGVVVEGAWRHGLWSGRVINQSKAPVFIEEIVLFELDHGLPPETRVYGESFQMLAQITGTLGAPEDLGTYPDRKHYRIPEAPGYRVASGLLTLFPAKDQVLALAFTSCNKFIGRIGFNQARLKAYLETEGLSLPPGGVWKLEQFGVISGSSRGVVLDKVAQAIQKNNPRPLPAKPPTGWCSWYTFYENVTVQDIVTNLEFSRKNLPELRYIQIDDGYQSRMGDWLETGKAFGGNIKSVLKQIRQAGFEPAIWVAPFIAEKDSLIFQKHLDWFVKDREGRPLDSSTIGFGGWRCAPWYVLDGTHPEVQKHLEVVFRTMREQWGVTYFKLDANYWGAIHGGKRFDPGATRIEAYRRGMEALRKGAGDAFILGCNAPMWPSLGLVDGMRTSGDIARSWNAFKSCGLENLSRGWQNGTLWWNDFDCLILTERSQKDSATGYTAKDAPLSENEFRLHAATIRASGGLVLSGDDLAQLKPERLAMLKTLSAPSGKAMSFDDADFTVGRVKLGDKAEEIALFNWGDQSVTRTVTIPPGSRVTDFWTGESEMFKGNSFTREIPPHSAGLFQLRK